MHCDNRHSLAPAAHTITRHPLRLHTPASWHTVTADRACAAGAEWAAGCCAVGVYESLFERLAVRPKRSHVWGCNQLPQEHSLDNACHCKMRERESIHHSGREYRGHMRCSFEWMTWTRLFTYHAGTIPLPGRYASSATLAVFLMKHSNTPHRSGQLLQGHAAKRIAGKRWQCEGKSIAESR